MTQHRMNTAHMYEQTITKCGSCVVILPVERMIKKRTMFSISQGSVAHTCSVEMKKVFTQTYNSLFSMEENINSVYSTIKNLPLKCTVSLHL